MTFRASPDIPAAVTGPIPSHDELAGLTYYRGRVALDQILRALKIGPGDLVATQAFTCIAVPEAILACGATPLFVDVETQGVNASLDDLKQKWNPRVRAIVLQHTFGIPASLDRFVPFAEAAGVPLIEDCCHTLDSSLHGRTVGSWGTAAFYSFEWGKPVVAGIGGAAWSRYPALCEQLRTQAAALHTPTAAARLKVELQYRAHQMLYRPQCYWPLKSLFHRLARLRLAQGNYNSLAQDAPATDFSWSMLPEARRRLKRKLAWERSAFADHSQALSDRLQAELQTSGIRLPKIPTGARTVFARLPLLVADKDRLLAKAREAGIELADWYRTPIHPLSPAEAGRLAFDPQECPQAVQRTHQIVSLPLHRSVRTNYMERVIDFLQRSSS